MSLHNESQVTVNSADFWSESLVSKTKKFTLEPPPEQIKETNTFKLSANSRKQEFKSSIATTNKSKGAPSSTAEYTPEMTASSGTSGRLN